MKGVCACGHTGGAPNSQHGDTEQPGHGSCKLCGCTRFTWKKYSMNMDEIARYLQSVINKGLMENYIIELTLEEIDAVRAARRIVMMQ